MIRYRGEWRKPGRPAHDVILKGRGNLFRDFFALTCVPVMAQSAQPDTYVGFEGTNVTSLEISARPSMNSRLSAPLIQQKAGEPFSEQGHPRQCRGAAADQ